MKLGKGQKIPLNENFLTIKFVRPDSALEIDTAAFLTKGNGKVACDEDFVFYSNARHNSGAVTHNDDDSIEIDLSRIPRHVEKISLTATIYDADKRRQNFGLIRDARLKILGADGEIATFPLENFTVETAIVLGEIYRYKGAWKFNAVGAGYKGGLAALCNDFGIEVNDVAPPTPPPTSQDDKPPTKIKTSRERSKSSSRREKITIPPPPSREDTPTSHEDKPPAKINTSRERSKSSSRREKITIPPPPSREDTPTSQEDKPPAKINTSRERSKSSIRREKITIPPPPSREDTPTSHEDKPPKKIELRKGQKISLVKKGATLGEIVINLNWSQPQQQNTGFFGRFLNRGIDLDLACLYELKDGTIGAIQALGNLFGELNYPPFIALDGDDRTGAIAAGETIRVNGKFVDKIRRILIYTFIYEGAANWEEAKGVVTVKCPGSPELIVRMDEYGSRKHTCAIALLENVGGTFSVEKVVQFFDDSEHMDHAFDWGLRWTIGRKD